MVAKTIGIIALKGGVGKTSCTANIGASLANDFGKKVLLVDANFNAPNLAIHFGLFDYNATLQEVLQGWTNIQKAVHKINDNLHLIPSSIDGKEVRDHYKLKEEIKKLKEFYDIILIDSSPNLHHDILSTMIASEELYVVTSPDYPTLSTTIRAVKLAKQRNTPIKGLILNRVYNKRFELSLDDIEESTGCLVLGSIPADLKIVEAVANTKPISTHSPKSDASVEVKKIAAYLIGEKYADPRVWAKIKNFLKGTPIKKEDVNRLLSNKLQ